MSERLSERYDSLSGKGLGVEYYGMTCTIVTMMLDRLCRKHRLEQLVGDGGCRSQAINDHDIERLVVDGPKASTMGRRT